MKIKLIEKESNLSEPYSWKYDTYIFEKETYEFMTYDGQTGKLVFLYDESLALIDVIVIEGTIRKNEYNRLISGRYKKVNKMPKF